MKPPHIFLTGLVILGLFIVMGTLIMRDMISNYDLNITTDEHFQGVYNTSEDMYEFSQDQKEDVILGDVEGGDESWESMTKGSYSSARRMITAPVRLIGDIADAMMQSIGVPQQFKTALMIIVTIYIVFVLTYLVFRFKPQ